jgi:arginyl-tRNA synthetase
MLALCQTFNEYYHRVPVLKADPETMKARLLILDSIRVVLASSLGLLGIEALEEM